MKSKNNKPSSPHLKNLQKDLARIERAQKYLENEKDRLMKDKEKVRIRIKKEKEILRLKNQIRIVKSRKRD